MLSTRYFMMLVMFYQCFCLSVVTNLLFLYVHVGTTGCYHKESLDSLTIILLYGSFLKIVISIYSLIIVFVRLVMFVKRICYNAPPISLTRFVQIQPVL